MRSVLNTISEYTYFYISKNITSYTFLLVFKIVESLKCILKCILKCLLKNLHLSGNKFVINFLKKKLRKVDMRVTNKENFGAA